MTDEEMIQQLQYRFDLSKVKATVIYFRLEEHFTKRGKIIKENLPESMKMS